MIRLGMEPHFDTDVLVVGGGPAGAQTAASLAAAGVDVLVVDRKTFPRDKVCGDFVGPAALVELERLGLDGDPRLEQGNVIRQAGLYVNGREVIRERLPEVDGLPGFGRVIPRVVLDDMILGAARSAGARVLEGASVTRFAATAEAIVAVVETPDGLRNVVARALVGADGSSSTIARGLRPRASERADRIIAIRAYYEGVEGPADRNDLYFTSDSFPGYGWLFPTGASTANVGVGMLLETVPAAPEHIRDLLARLVAEDPALGGRLRNASLVGRVAAWPLSTFNPRARLVADRVLLVGDAAGLINPLNGEGIQYALSSGHWASEALVRALSTGDLGETALAPYADRVRSELRYDMALARAIIAFISNRTLNPLWLEAVAIIAARARRDPAYARITGGVLAGLVPAREVLVPRVIVGTANQAARTVATDAAFTVFRGPRAIRGAARSLSRLATDVAAEGVRDPRATARWVGGVVAALADLALEGARDLAEPHGGADNGGVAA